MKQQQSLALSFRDSLASDITDGVSELVEVGIDAVLEDGIFQEIPLVSTMISLYRIGSSIRDRHNIKKLVSFIDQMRRGCIDEETLQKYRGKIVSDEKKRNRELEYILILVDRYISYDKPRMLAKLYLAYLDGEIIWEEFSMYAEVIDRFLLLDCRTLTTESEKIIVPRNRGGESVLRLVALGLMTEETDFSAYRQEPDGNLRVTWGTLMQPLSPNKTYVRTEFGEKLANILR